MLWPPRKHDLAYYTQLAQAVGFEVAAQGQQGRVLFIQLRKPQE